LEYAVIIAVVVAGLIVIQPYIKRSMQGKLRESTDKIGEQYSAGNMTGKYTTEQVAEMKTQETFGLATADQKTPQQGVSHYEITTPAETQRSATGNEAETVNKALKDETLF
jgi:hypothetical protein